MTRLCGPGLLYIIGVGLVLSILISYWPALNADFVNYDDDGHVTNNVHVKEGLSRGSMAWALTSMDTGIWHPLVWWSHMLDWEMSGSDPIAHHRTSVLLHMANTVLLLLLLSRLTGLVWRSAFCSALFALHPLHVESVAWISERKDVLSTFFFLLTIIAYVSYTRKPGVSRYIPVASLFVLALMSKPMVVTLPVLLLLLDYWPLGRLDPHGKGGSVSVARLRPLLVEKLPLVLLAVAGSVVAVISQSEAGAIATVKEFGVGVRISNAAWAYCAYIARMLWPRDLAVFYPHPGDSLPVWQVALAALAFIGVSAIVLSYGRRFRYLVVGWWWYVVTLLPVIGLVQIGEQAIADRYTYIPMVGLLLAVSWGVPDAASLLTRAERPASFALGAAGLAVVFALSAVTYRQSSYWLDSGTLFRHALAVTKRNYLAHVNLGFFLYENGDVAAAVRHYLKALEIRPDYARAHYNLAVTYEDMGHVEAAKREYEEALRSEPAMVAAHNNLGRLLMREGRTDEAIREYRAAIESQPDFAVAHSNLAVALYTRGDYSAAWRHVHLAQKHGVDPPWSFLDALSQMEPEPAR